MRVEPLGEWACVLQELPWPPSTVAAAVRARDWQGVLDVVPCIDSVGVFFEPPFDPDCLQTLNVDTTFGTLLGRTLVIPVCYDLGEDLPHASNHLRLSREEFIGAHCGQPWPCFAVGFCPGFAYLGPLTDALSGLPRLSNPRLRTPAGSVGITGRQTAVYPLERPGGWLIIGKTPLCLVNVADGYFPIEAGDSVQFSSITLGEFEERQGERL